MNIPDTWIVTTVGKLCDQGGGSVQTGPFGSQLHAEDYRPDGVPVVMPQNLGRNKIEVTDIARIDDKDVKRLAQHRLVTGDIVFPRRGDISRYAYITEEYEGWLCGTGCLRIRLGESQVDPKYLAYYLGHPEAQNWIIGNAVGTTMLNLNTSIVRALPVVVPSPPEQRAIAYILGTLDDKIELNRRMNATLEAIARAIFKSWFLDFEPVHAKARGEQPYGMDAETAALFPDAFEESELGPIPAGWGIKPIGEVVTVVGGSTPSTAVTEYWENGTIDWVTPKDLASLSNPVLLETSRQITEKGLAQISSGLLPKGTVLLSSRAPIGYLAIAEIPVAVNQGFIAMVCDRGLSNHYILWWTQANIELIKNRANGTTFLEVSKRNFRPMPVLVPLQPILNRFDSIIAPLYRRIAGNCRESRTLVELRDTVLPRLISGELRVRETETGDKS